ncbi:MAG: glycosyltransferase [Bacteroidales bacterium]|nr:glycosyltransferase [Bacteroidales bacterium]
MEILFTGNYNPNYNRTLIIKSGLKANNINFLEIPIHNNLESWKNKISDIINKVDYVFIPPFAHKTVKFIKKFTKKRIIFDPLISQYMTRVYDFQKYPYYSPRALKYYFIDKIAFKNSDIIIADTQNHLKYFQKTYKIPLNKLEVLYIGVDNKLFYPLNMNHSTRFKVGFYGCFLPLQGVNKIIETARILKKHEDIIFELIGTGRGLEEAKRLVKKYNLSNVVFKGWIEYERLNDNINNFDICLGIFGDSIKTELVIPNKAFHYSACKKCMITKKTKGIQEIYTDEKDVILTNGHFEDIAEKILFLKNNQEKRKEIAENTYNLITNKYNDSEIAKNFIKIISKF